jgi:signal peptide peptidase SppA
MAEARSSGVGVAAVQTCRPDQLFGLWAIEETRFRQYVALAKGADLEKLRAESMAAAEKVAAGPPYQVTADGIAIIDIAGPMTKYPTSFQALFGGTSTLRTREALRAAVRDPDVHGIMVRVDSPGGTVAGGAELAEDIRRTAARKPLHTYGDDLAASAGLLALAQGSKAWASTNAEVGSIGVYMVVEDTSQVYAQEGVKVHVVSSAPPYKGAGVEGTEITPAQLAEWQRRVSDTADWFVNEVSRGRRMAKDQVQKLATGQVWIADKARELGLIDGVLSFDEALSRLRSQVMEAEDTKAAVALAEETQAKLDTEKQARAAAEKATVEALAKAQAAEAKLAEIEAGQRATTFTAKAKTLKLPTEAATILDQVEKAIGAEAFAKLEGFVSALANQVDESKLFGELGTSAAGAEGTVPAAERIQALAAERVKAGTSKTLADAMTAVCEENPELYKLHREEQNKGAR